MATALPGTGVPVSTDPITTLNGAAATASEVVQRLKISTGAPGTATDVTTANPLPISGPVTGTFFQATQPVSAASLPLPAGASTETTLAALNTKVTAVNTGAVVLAASTATVGLVQLNFGTPAAPTLASYGNPVPVQISGGFSNSFTGQDTTAVLAANGVFTGGGGDTAAEYSNISILIFTSHASAVDGLQVQHSLDGTNYDVIDKYTVPASTTGAGSNFIVPCRSQSFRVVYTNGATAQTAFRMRTVLLKVDKSSTSRPQDARPNEAAVQETVSLLAGYNGATWDRLRSSTANGLAVDVTRIIAPLPTGANTIGTVNMAAPSPTYAAAVSGLVPASLATDIFTINGSATKTIRISKLSVNGVQTTAGQVAISIIKRSTANAGGTSTAQIRVPYDSVSAASTASVLAYTANPTTLGTVVGTITASRLFVPGVASATDAQGFSMVVGDVGQQFVTIRGAAENLAVNLNGVTITGGAVNVTIEWTES